MRAKAPASALVFVALVVLLIAGAAAPASAQRVVRHAHPHTVDHRASPPPATYNVSGVPWHEQLTDFDCGAASSQMVLQYWASGSGADADALNQYDIMDVARTTSSSGTWSTDILRVGRFSALSTPALDWYAANSTCPGAGAADGAGAEPCHGFARRPVGAAAYGRGDDAFWLNELKAVIAADHPVIILMNWDATPERDGHYRVLIGYDDTLQRVYFNDPWGRDQAPVQAFSYANFSVAWNYTEQGHAPAEHWKPYWAALFAPWRVDLTVTPVKAQPQPQQSEQLQREQQQHYEIVADVTYPLFSAFPVADPHAHTTADTLVSVTLSDGLLLVDTERSAVSLGPSAPGARYTVRWHAYTTDSAAGDNDSAGSDRWLAAQRVHVSARGVLHSHADRIYCCGGPNHARAQAIARTRGQRDRRAVDGGTALLTDDDRDDDDDGAGVASTASSARRMAAEYYFPAYDYADVIGGSATQSLADLLA